MVAGFGISMVREGSTHGAMKASSDPSGVPSPGLAGIAGAVVC